MTSFSNGKLYADGVEIGIVKDIVVDTPEEDKPDIEERWAQMAATDGAGDVPATEADVHPHAAQATVHSHTGCSRSATATIRRVT